MRQSVGLLARLGVIWHTAAAGVILGLVRWLLALPAPPFLPPFLSLLRGMGQKNMGVLGSVESAEFVRIFLPSRVRPTKLLSRLNRLKSSPFPK